MADLSPKGWAVENVEISCGPVIRRPGVSELSSGSPSVGFGTPTSLDKRQLSAGLKIGPMWSQEDIGETLVDAEIAFCVLGARICSSAVRT